MLSLFRTKKSLLKKKKYLDAERLLRHVRNSEAFKVQPTLFEEKKVASEMVKSGEIDYEAVARASEGLSGRTLVGDKQGIFSSLLYRAKELSDKQGSLYVVTTQNWLEEIQKVKPESTKRTVGFH